MNRKELLVTAVTVWDVRVEFYKQDAPLAEWARPTTQLVGERGEISPMDPMALPPHIPVRLTLSIRPERDDIRQEMANVDRAEFVEPLIGASDQRRDLDPPWGLSS